MSIILDEMNLSYVMLTPFPFDERVFITHIDGKFTEKEFTRFGIGAEGIDFFNTTVYEFGESRLNFSPERGIVGIIGGDYSDVNEGFNIIDTIIAQHMEFDMTQVTYLEMAIKGRYTPKYKPLEKLKNFYKFPISDNIQQLVPDYEMTPMCIRLCSTDEETKGVPFQRITNWGEFRFEPMIKNPNIYYFELVYRRDQPDIVKNLWANIKERLQETFETIDELE